MIRIAWLTDLHLDFVEPEAAVADFCRRVADAAEYFRDILPRAFARSRRVVLLTHVPPFAEAAWHPGRMCRCARTSRSTQAHPSTARPRSSPTSS